MSFVVAGLVLQIASSCHNETVVDFTVGWLEENRSN